MSTEAGVVRWLTAFIDAPRDTSELAERFWCAVTATHLSPRRGPDGEFATLLPTSGDAHLRLQRVRGGPGGIHLDLHTVEPEALARRAVDLGAEQIHSEPGLVVLRSPGGLPWCAVEWHDEAQVPPPVHGPQGACSRLDQVCIDAGPEQYGPERNFWMALTGWPAETTTRPEFTMFRPSPDQPQPMRLLLQRLERADTAVSAHLDFACGSGADAFEQTRHWHTTLGARCADRRSRWQTMIAPDGMMYCLTERDPVTGRAP